MDLFDKILELSQQGFYCAQILAILALEADGKENPDLIRAMSGLNGGIGFSGKTCGALTGGACVLSYFTGKGEADELEAPESRAMIQEYINWFETEFGEEHGGTGCDEILECNPANRLERCPGIVGAAFEKVVELLSEKGVV
ncbi:DVU_1555 family C-GCAxxG-C-C protein [Oscillospiraceae bacterium LTW-04]|nr:C-GCAxxG-C-C family protein [Oscillospiraceae bacterium MB24-C1]